MSNVNTKNSLGKFTLKEKKTNCKQKTYIQTKTDKSFEKNTTQNETQNVGFGHTVCCMQRITNENKTQSPEKSGSFDSLGQRVDIRSAQSEK